MANRRMMYQDFFEDDYFGQIDHTGQILWIGLIVAMADDQGRLIDNTDAINSKVFFFSHIDSEELHSYLDSFRIANKIVRYNKDGRGLIQIVNWWKYQTPSWASPSNYPPPDGWVDRVKCHIPGNQRKKKQGGNILNINWGEKGGFPDKLHSYLPKAINDVNDDVNDDDNINDDSDDKLSDQNDLFSQCQRIYESKKGRLISDPQGFVQMINNFKANDVTVEDYAAAIDAMDADPNYTGNRPTSYEKWAIGYATKRKNPVTAKTIGKQLKRVVKIGPNGEEYEFFEEER